MNLTLYYVPTYIRHQYIEPCTPGPGHCHIIQLRQQLQCLLLMSEYQNTQLFIIFTKTKRMPNNAVIRILSGILNIDSGSVLLILYMLAKFKFASLIVRSEIIVQKMLPLYKLLLTPPRSSQTCAIMSMGTFPLRPEPAPNPDCTS